MSKTYETSVHAAAFVHGFLTSPGFRREITLGAADRFRLKKLIAAFEDIPEHVQDMSGYHLFGADLTKPINVEAHQYQIKTNSTGEPITTCRVKLSADLVDLLWHQVFERLLSRIISQDMADNIEKWVKDFGLEAELAKLEAALEPKDEPQPAEVKP